MKDAEANLLAKFTHHTLLAKNMLHEKEMLQQIFPEKNNLQ